MKRAALILAALAAILTAAAAPVRTATENFVTNKIAEAVAAIPAPDFSTNNTELVATIETKAPAPGNYAVVSNAAMNAVQTETDPAWNVEKSGYATKDDLTNKVDKSGVLIGSMFIGFTDEGIYVRDVGTGKGVILSDDMMARKTATGEVFYYAYPNGSGTLAFTSDIPSTNGFLKVETDPTVPSWAMAASKPSYTAGEVGATTPEDVTAAIREQSLGGIWDEALQVWWTPVMRNGSLTYQATTNVNLNAEN